MTHAPAVLTLLTLYSSLGAQTLRSSVRAVATMEGHAGCVWAVMSLGATLASASQGAITGGIFIVEWRKARKSNY